MTKQTSTAPEHFEYRAEMKQLLHLIIHSLYTHRDVFLRELVSNASDALNKARLRSLTDPEMQSAAAPLEIRIRTDADAGTLEIEDTGIGMTHDDLVERIGTVASSGTLAFLESLKTEGKPVDAQLIGRFGVGFYSAFMVAREITIETRHADPDAQGWRWTSDGEGSFTVEPIDRVERGTSVTLALRDDATEFADAFRVKQIIRKYSNFVDFPIHVDGEQVNTVRALWRTRDEISDEELAEFYKFVTNDFADPLGHLHLNLEGQVDLKALLFVPAQAPPDLFREELRRGLHLYANNVFIQDDAEILPEYLRFVRGVVDTDDLPLNVSREVTQRSQVMNRIRTILTGKVLGLLEEWAEDDPEKYAAFFDQFGPLFKTGVGQDFANRDRLLDLLRFESTATEPGERTSLAAYVERMPDDQDAVYYALGDSRDALLRNPNLEYFRRTGLEVLLLTHPVDVFTTPAIGAYREKPLRSIEKADLDFDADVPEDALPEAEADAVIARFKQVLGDRVEDVRASKRLVDSAATLVVGEQGLDPQVERMMKMMGQELPATAKVMEINTAHPLLRNLARLIAEGEHDEVVDAAVEQLYAGALLIEGNLDEPTDFVARMTRLMVEATR